METPKQYAIVELFGHKALAGAISEVTIAGMSFLKIEVPATRHYAAWEKTFHPNAVYAITPATEEMVLAAAERYDEAPLPGFLVGKLTAPALVSKIEERIGDPDFEDDPYGYAEADALYDDLDDDTY